MSDIFSIQSDVAHRVVEALKVNLFPNERERLGRSGKVNQEAYELFLPSRRRHTRCSRDWSSDVCSSDLSASRLILEQLLPLARAGLKAAGVDASDVDLYLGTLEERVRTGQTGAEWTLKSLASLGNQGTRDMRHRALAAAMRERQQTGEPVHRWPVIEMKEPADWSDSYRTVGQFMSTDLFTVRPDDLVDFAASVMDWRHIRHVPVEDDEGRLVGLV